MLIGNYAVGQEMIGCAHTPISILVPPDFEPGAPGIYFPGVFFLYRPYCKYAKFSGSHGYTTNKDVVCMSMGTTGSQWFYGRNAVYLKKEKK